MTLVPKSIGTSFLALCGGIFLLGFFLLSPSRAFAATTLKPELSWQRSLETDAAVVHETTIGSMVPVALTLPMDANQTVWDDGVHTGEPNKSIISAGISWASWQQYSWLGDPDGCGHFYDLRHFRATFSLSASQVPSSGQLILRSPYYAGNTLPINDNAYIYLNGNFVGRRGTSYGARNLGMRGTAPYANETDGWVADGLLDDGAVTSLQKGTNVLDVVAGEYCRWGGLGKLELVIESTSPPPVEPFLELPFDAKGKSFEEVALDPESWFDHQYPLQNVPCCVKSILGYTGITESAYYRSHSGYDYSLKNGVQLNTPVLAAADGEATFTPLTKSGGAGHMIKIDHGNGYQTWYEHLSKDGLVVSSEGTSVHVAKGQQIGKVGMTGNTNGPHIHFSVFKPEAGYPFGLVDPLGWEGENPDPWEIYETGGKHGEKSVNLFLARAKPKSTEMPTTGGSFSSGNVSVIVPAGAAGQPFSLNFVLGPFEKVGGQIGSVVNSFFLTAFDGAQQKITQFSQPITLSINYAGADLKNILENSLRFYFFNEQNKAWEEQPSVLDVANKTVITTTNHFSQFAVAGTIKDLIAPTTTVNIAGTKGQDGWYRSPVSVVLSGQDNPGGVGIHYTLYSLNGDDWFPYQTPVSFPGDGQYGLSYESIDEADNREERKKVEFNIDTATPEAKIFFDKTKKKIVVEGVDANLAKVTENNGVFSVSDLAGNVLVLKTKPITNGSQYYMNFLGWPNTLFYVATGTGTMTQFFQLNGTKIVIINFDAKRNQSVIQTVVSKRWVKETRSGQAFLQIYTEKGSLKWRII